MAALRQAVDDNGGPGHDGTRAGCEGYDARAVGAAVTGDGGSVSGRQGTACSELEGRKR